MRKVFEAAGRWGHDAGRAKTLTVEPEGETYRVKVEAPGLGLVAHWFASEEELASLRDALKPAIDSDEHQP